MSLQFGSVSLWGPKTQTYLHCWQSCWDWEDPLWGPNWSDQEIAGHYRWVFGVLRSQEGGRYCLGRLKHGAFLCL